jgi:protein O-GlcNAc transferase
MTALAFEPTLDIHAEHALTGDPSTDHSYLMRALEAQGRGDTVQAEYMFRNFLAAYPGNPIASYSMAVILLHRRDREGALQTLEAGVAANPGFAPLWLAKGSAEHGLGLREEALKSYDQAIGIKPDYLEALVNSGALLREMHKHAEALQRFQAVLTFQPDYQTALGNSAILLSEFKQLDQAIATLQRLLQINPDYDYGLGLLAYERLHACDWTDHDALQQAIIEGLREGKRTCKSLGLMALSDSAADHQQCARIFSAHHLPESPPPLWQGERYRHDRIRVAYMSPDLREHPVGHLMAGIFEHHDHHRFETIAVSLGANDGSRLRQRMVNAFDHFIDARDMSSRHIAETLRRMEVDILIDLAGYTSDARTDVLAHRPAPAHVNYLGYPGTMGYKEMDYLIADRCVIPPEHQCFYDERVLYLPDAYLPTDDKVQIAERTPTRAECGLPDDAFVFCSFCHDYKISPSWFDMWMRILSGAPGSVLWLMSRNAQSQANLRQAAQARGVDPQRLIFASRVPLIEAHLARYRQASLFLDTHPYNAHTTAADALMAGLPVLTYLGGSFPSRVASSLVSSIGLNELVTHSHQAYEDTAIRIANNADLHQDIRSRLERQRAGSGLFDTPAFCRHLEALYTQIWYEGQLQRGSHIQRSTR